MKKQKSTKRALLMSALSLLLCMSMLVGTTFAWFTDEVTSAGNIIQSGKLDVDLVDGDGNSMAGKVINFVTPDGRAQDKILWEPGCTYDTESVYVKNNGNLALKYQIVINGIDGDAKLLEAIEWTVYVDGAATALADLNNTLLPGETSKAIILRGHMKEEAGNEYQDLTVEGISITVYATQLTHESDSFGPNYDAAAPWTGSVDTGWYWNNPDATTFEIGSPEELAGLAALVNGTAVSPVATFATDSATTTPVNFVGKTIKLGADIDLRNINWTPIGTSSNGFCGTFDGQGHTIYNLTVNAQNCAGLFGYALNGGNVKNLNIENAVITAHDYAGAVMGRGYTDIDNCHVKNVTVITTPYLTEAGIYDGGAKAGGVIGQMLEGSGNTVTNCSATDVKIYGFRDIGGVVGMVHNNNSASGNTAVNVTLGYVLFDKITADKNENAGAVYGRVQSSATVSPEKDSAENKDFTQVYVVYDALSLTSLANFVNTGNDFKGKTVVVIEDIDLGGMAWTPIGNSTYSFKGTFEGNGKTIRNLAVNMPGKSNVGLFGMTTEGEIKNLTVENAIVTGRLNVGVVAGTPYTSKYTNITVKGHVEVNGMSYVGGVGGKNAYANWNNITVDVDETSYVKADSVENGIAYRTYVGGVVGFNGEGGHSFTNITSNINVFGSSCDVGGAFGIAHYGNKFENVTVTGDVTITNAPEASDAEEMGGIAGVWHNGGADVTFDGCSFTGTLTANITEDVDLSDNIITGAAYSANGTGKLVIIGYAYIGNEKYDTIAAAVADANNGDTIRLTAGTFYEAVNLQEKSLTIQGAGKGVTIIAGPEDYTTENIPMQSWAGWNNGRATNDDRNVYALISADEDVTIKDLTVKANPTQIGEVGEFRWEGDYAFVGIHVQSANATIENVNIEGIKPDTVTGNDHHNFGLYITSAVGDTNTYTATYKNGTVSDVNRGAIYCWSGNYTLNFEDVTVIGPGGPTNPNETLTPAAGSENNNAIYAFCSFYVCSPATYENVVIRDAWCVAWWGGASWAWANPAWSTNPPTGVTCVDCGTAN